jgi:hypothetical protein
MKQTARELPYLDADLLDLIFNHVYGRPEDITDEQTRDFINMLKSMQDYNYHYRSAQLQRIFPLAEAIIGPFEINSEGTSIWLALILAIRELYGMQDETLKHILQQISVRK